MVVRLELEWSDRTAEKWCCRGDLNSRPLPYQGSALPLSYGSVRRLERWRAATGDHMPSVKRECKPLDAAALIFLISYNDRKAKFSPKQRKHQRKSAS